MGSTVLMKSKILGKLVKKYSENRKKPIPFNFKTSSIYLLGEKNKSNTNLHHIHYYPGKIFPYIPLYMLAIDDFKKFNGYVLDPFAGSGTILLESILNPVVKRNALGVEINPLGRLISKVKTTPLDIKKIEEHLRTLSSLYKDETNANYEIPDFKNRELWFSENAYKKLAKLKYAIRVLNADSDYKDFFWACFSSIIRKVSKADPFIPPPVVLKPEKYINSPRKYQFLKKFLQHANNPDVWKKFEEIVHNNKNKLSSLNKVIELKNRTICSEVIWDDARNIKRGKLCECGKLDKKSVAELPSGCIDLIFTSPPYITAQKYIRTSRLELLWLGYSEKEIGALEKMSIGTENVGKNSKISTLGIDSIDSIIDYAVTRSFKRALTVFEYFNGMLESLKEMHRLLRDDGYAILVVGNNKVLGKRVDTYRLLADAAVTVGFLEEVILKDTIRSRSMMTKRNGTGGIIKDEYVIVLKKVG